MYDPGLGRFPSADSIVSGATDSLGVDYHELGGLLGSTSHRFGTPGSLGRYSYVLNNPVRNIDPTGHRSDTSNSVLPPDSWGIMPGGLCGFCTNWPGIGWLDGNSNILQLPPGMQPPNVPPSPGMTTCDGRFSMRLIAPQKVRVLAAASCSYIMGAIVVISAGDFTTPTKTTAVGWVFACSNFWTPLGAPPCGEDGRTLIQDNEWNTGEPGFVIGTVVIGGIDMRGAAVVPVSFPLYASFVW